jgi:chemotaxis protein methyltransferase CheR
MKAMTLSHAIDRPGAISPPSEQFLRWALPRLGLTWSGFRRVRRQVWRRVGRRLAELHLSGPDAYRAYLLSHAEEWPVLDGFCRIPISRFWRDREVFERLAQDILPELAGHALRHGDGRVRAWSAGCASGEEPYSLLLLWRFEVGRRYPDIALELLATDIDDVLLARARAARYRRSSMREMPTAWRDAAFIPAGDALVLRDEFRSGVVFRRADLRVELPDATFDLILCRNLVCTYFGEPLQRLTLGRMCTVLRPGGALVLGKGERLPSGLPGITDWIPDRGIFRRAPALEACVAPNPEAPPWN